MRFAWRDRRAGLALVVLAWLVATAASAQSLELSDAPRQVLAGHLAVLGDSTGNFDVAAVRREDDAGRFRSIPGGGFSLGFPEGAVWIRLSVSNPTAVAQERWLVLDNALLASVELHWQDGSGAATRMVSGATIPVERRPLASGQLLFPLALGAGQAATVYLRVSGPMAAASTMTIWQPVAYAEAEWRLMAFKVLVVVGAVMVVVLVSLFFWQHNKRLAFLSVGIAEVLFGAATFMVDGIAAGWLPASEQFWQGRVTGMLVLLGLFFHVVFARAFLDLPRTAPALSRGMSTLAGLSLVAAVAQGFTTEMKLLTFQIALAITAVGSVMVALAAWRGVRIARLFVLTWLARLGVFLLLMAGALAKIPTAVHASILPLPSFLIASLVLAYAMYREARLASLATERTHRHLLDLRRTEQERLTMAVESRTRELREAKAQAEEAGKARLAFLSTVSHELRTPLHTILGYAQLLRRRNGRREADAKLATIESSGLQLLRLIDEILEFIRGDSQSVALKSGTVALAELARQADDTGQVLALARHNRFSVELLGDLPATVEVDERRLLQVLDNLISNSCKYTSSGCITMRIEPEKAASGEAPLAGIHRLRFTVEDTGVGIPADQRARLFEPFSRLAGREYQPGIGLGLAIARQIVRAMGGDIGVDSEPGRGSRFFFTLTLPTGASEVVDRVAVLPQILGHLGRRRTLLVADDIAENRQFLHDLCSDWGFRVLTAGDGAEALAICRSADVVPDCVLIDQFMPGMDGWAFLTEFRTMLDRSSPPVILVSAAGPQRPAGLPAEFDFDGVLLKPIRQHELADSLQRLLELEWIFGQTNDVGRRAGQAARMPPASELAVLREMLSLGRVVAIQRRAEQLAAEQPDLADFAFKAAMLAEAVDLAGLEHLLQRAESGIAGYIHQAPSAT